MALIKCSECQKEISDKSTRCPHCGIKIKKTNIFTFILTILIIGLFVLSPFFIKSQSAGNPDQIVNSESLNTCTIEKISTEIIKIGYTQSCKSDGCIYLNGVLSLKNNCNEPIGIKVKLVGYDKNHKAVMVNDFWPGSISNLKQGENILSLDHALDYDPSIKTFSIEPIQIEKWK